MKERVPHFVYVYERNTGNYKGVDSLEQLGEVAFSPTIHPLILPRGNVLALPDCGAGDVLGECLKGPQLVWNGWVLAAGAKPIWEELAVDWQRIW